MALKFAPSVWWQTEPGNKGRPTHDGGERRKIYVKIDLIPLQKIESSPHTHITQERVYDGVGHFIAPAAVVYTEQTHISAVPAAVKHTHTQSDGGWRNAAEPPDDAPVRPRLSRQTMLCQPQRAKFNAGQHRDPEFPRGAASCLGCRA